MSYPLPLNSTERDTDSKCTETHRRRRLAVELVSPTPHRRPRCCLGLKHGTSKLASKHGTPTVTTPSGLEHIGISTAATTVGVSDTGVRRYSGEVCLAQGAATDPRRYANEGGQHHVPVDAQNWPRRRQGGTFHRCKARRRSLNTRRFRTAARNHSGTPMQTPKACSVRALDTAAHDQPTF